MDRTPEAGIFFGSTEDFPKLYEDMQQQFPPCELYPYSAFLQWLNHDGYRILLYKRISDGELLGYALVYPIENSNILWIDYLAVMKKYQSCGIGKALFRAILQKYCGPFDGMLFSVEHVSQDDPQQALAQERRIAFYESLGAHRLHANFLQPTENGSFPMYLYFMPCRGYTTISRAVQIQSITQMYEYLFSRYKHIRELLPLYKDTIVDESFTD